MSQTSAGQADAEAEEFGLQAATAMLQADAEEAESLQAATALVLPAPAEDAAEAEDDSILRGHAQACLCD